MNLCGYFQRSPDPHERKKAAVLCNALNHPVLHYVKIVACYSIEFRRWQGLSANLEFMGTPSPSFDRRSIAATLLFIEGGVVLALGVWLVILGFTHEDREILPLLGVVLFCVLGGFGLIQCGRGYKEGKNYGRAPAVLANLIALGVVKYQTEAGLYYVAIPLALLAVTTLGTVLKIASQENRSK